MSTTSDTTTGISISPALYNVAVKTLTRTVGPMPAQDFLDKFLPRIRKTYARNNKNACSNIPTRRRYKPLVSYPCLSTVATPKAFPLSQ